ncbi:MAG: AAA family ATPase, partial [Mediterranea sp.]|nr:AAA family ATPase [Mediterranea sp.]
MERLKSIPYGISNFEQIINRNYYYVDKTMYLPLLERAANNLLLIRPRRFGKSLFIDMMKAYYDISEKDKFQEMFGNLWIGGKPTDEQGMYQVLYFDFSKANLGEGTLEHNFNVYCNEQLERFLLRYASFYPKEEMERVLKNDSAASKLHWIEAAAKAMGYPLYLIIDEYDNFTNVVLSESGPETFYNLTHANGFYREYFKQFKGMFYRIFLTGVSPITLDDLTSGFNIDWNISNEPRFNAMLGFDEQDVRTMFRYYQEGGILKGDIDAMIQEMKPWYDNYCFSRKSLQDPRLFNCDTVLYYLQHRVESGEAPEQMLSKNIRTDYSKLEMLVRLDKDITLRGQRMSTIEEITTKEEILVDLKTSFPANDMVKAENYRSLLYYYGLLTISGVRGNRLKMCIP